MEIITRDQYSTKIDQWIGKGMIIVVTGQRRIGKSSILKDFVRRHSQEANANIIYIDKERREYRFIKDQETLGDYLEAQLKKRKHNYILIDEIQDIDGWEHAIRSFRTEDNTDIIITGSNSRMLSSELSTLLSGRYVEIPVQGLSYMEFLLFHKLPDSDDALRQYLFYGGLPGLCQIGLTDEDLIWNYQKSVFDTVMLKDVVERHNIRNIPFLRILIEYLADTTGKPQSAGNISRHMKSQGLDVSVNMILDYMSYFREAYLTNTVQRYDIHGKRILENLQKVYFGDVGLRNHIVGGERERDIEKVIETVVYQHLVRLGYSVTVGELRVGEIDFVCQKSNQIRYVQSAYLIDNEDTRMREFGRLSQIRNHYPKYVVSLTPMVKASDYDGVTHLGLREFLIKGI
jgi:predicted AAA+ superfamily ATPase